MEKLIINTLRIISKSHTHFQIMIKAPVQFQKDQHKTVGGGVADEELQM